MVVGQSLQTKNLKRANRNFHYYVSNWDAETKDEEVFSHLKSFITGYFEIESIKLNHTRFRAFRVTVDDSQEQVMLQPQNWPEGIVVKRYYFPRIKTSDTNTTIANGKIVQLAAISTTSAENTSKTN